MLHPVPSDDPNEPLVRAVREKFQAIANRPKNWSTARKAINFTLVLAVTCLIFTAYVQPDQKVWEFRLANYENNQVFLFRQFSGN